MVECVQTGYLVPLRLNYDFLLGYGTLLVNAESLDEILADKIVAFPASVKNIRYRDIWDLAWLVQQDARLVPSLVEQKIGDYRIEGFEQLLGDAIVRLPALIAGKPFKDQMTRFIDAETISRTLDEPDFVAYLANTVGGLLNEMAENLKNDPEEDAEPKFRM